MIFLSSVPWLSSFGAADSNTQGCLSWAGRFLCHEAHPQGSRGKAGGGAAFRQQQFCPSITQAVAAVGLHRFDPSCRSCREWGGRQGWGRQLLWDAASKRDFSWGWRARLAEHDKDTCCVEERTLSCGQKIVLQMQADELSLQKVRMTQATFQEICRKHSSELQRQCRRGSTIIEKLSYHFKITKPLPSCLLLNRLAQVGHLWGHEDESLSRETSPLHMEACAVADMLIL